MKVVVTGGSGQLGTLVVSKLIADRRVKSIVSLDLVPPQIVPAPKLAWKIADVRDPGLDRHFEGADALVHLAFILARRASRDEMRAVNVDGSRRMFELAAGAGAKTIVYSSSISAYGLDPARRGPLDETSARVRTTEIGYFESKFDVEAELDRFEPQHPEMRIVRLRPSVLIGRRMPSFAAAPIWNGAIALFGDAPMPIVWDEDVADAVIATLFNDARGAFNLATDDPLSPRELLRSAGLAPLAFPRGAARSAITLSARFNRELDPAWLRAIDAEWPLSNERAKRELGWKPRCATAAAVMRRFVEVVPHRTDARARTFFSLIHVLSRFRDPSKIPEDARRMKIKIHIELTGPHGGDFIFDVAEGRARLTPGIPRPPDTTVSLSTETLLALLAGDDDPTRARLAGRVRIRGEPNGAFAVGGLITGFRAGIEKGGFEGWSARRLERWFSRGRKAKAEDRGP